MKKLILLALLSILPIMIIAQTRFSFAQYVIVNSSTTTPIQLTNTAMQVRSVTIIGKKGYQTTNTTAINIGVGTSTDGLMGLTVDPGLAITLKSIQPNATFSLSNIWLDVTTANDGAVVYWEP